MLIGLLIAEAGGRDEYQGNVVYTFTLPNGKQLGTQAHSCWLQSCELPLSHRGITTSLLSSHFSDPEGLRALINYLYKKYKKPIYCTENGFSVKNEGQMTLEQAIIDNDRVDFYRGALENVLRSIREDGVDIRSYFGWSLLE